MLTIKIICVGRIAAFYKQSAEEYAKRLSRFAKLSVIELPDEKAPESYSTAQKNQVLETEGERILPKLEGYVVALDLAGRQADTAQFAALLDSLPNSHSKVSFVIGGSLGLGDSVLRRADYRLCFSPMTFTHSLARVMLLEQLYRSFKINSNQPYHK